MNLSEYRSAHTLTFNDNFDQGSLNTNAWAISVGPSPVAGGGANGSFTSNSVSLSLGCLQLRLTQNTTFGLGGEVSTTNTFSYGLFEWTARLASTATTPTGVGEPKSGGVSSGFIFVNDSETELDVELQGQFPYQAEFTTFHELANVQTTAVHLDRVCDGFKRYSILWLPGSVSYYVSDLLVAVHTDDVPSTPANIFMNHWATNSDSFGGVRTTGVQRYAYYTNARHYAN